MLKATNITKSYGNVSVLNGIDMEVGESEIVSIVGKSGAGKSTLLQILGTLDDPDTGEVSFQNKNISDYSKKELNYFRNQNIGFIFQFHHLLPEFDALENAALPALVSGTAKSKALDQSRELLEYLGLSDRLHHKPSQMSGGEQQRVAIARALVNKPDIVFADEPTGNLDGSTSEEMQTLFSNMRQDFKVSFVIVTHDLSFTSMSNQVLKIQNGIFINE